MYENSFPELRYKNTIALIEKYISPKDIILDLGVINPFTKILEEKGYKTRNTGKTDLDLQPELVKTYDAHVVLALEILEHLVSPFPLLQNLPRGTQQKGPLGRAPKDTLAAGEPSNGLPEATFSAQLGHRDLPKDE